MIKKVFNRNRSNSNGATFIEAMIVMLVFFGLIGGFYNYAIIFHRYNALSDAVTSAVRKLSVNVNPNGVNPNFLASEIVNPHSEVFIGNFVSGFLSSHAATSNVSQISVNPADVSICRSANGLCRIKVKAVWPTPCYICIFNRSIDVTVMIESGFEDPCFISNQPLGCDAIARGDCVNGS